MIKQVKVYALFIAVLFLFISNSACTQDKEPENKVAALSKANSESMDDVNQPSNQSLGSVLTIESVGKPNQGEAVNFNWSHGGKQVSFSEFTKNKVVFLNFWGTWCPPCRKEVPDIIQIYNDLQGKDFVVIGISMERDQQNARTTVEQFIQKNKVPYMNFIATPEIINAYGGITGVPTTFIIDKNGKISDKIVGARDKATFMQLIDKVLK